MKKSGSVVGYACAKESDVPEFFPSKAKLKKTRFSVFTFFFFLTLMCQLFIRRQKSHCFCHNRIEIAFLSNWHKVMLGCMHLYVYFSLVQSTGHVRMCVAVRCRVLVARWWRTWCWAIWSWPFNFGRLRSFDLIVWFIPSNAS
jgi:hypothetical protein